MTFHALTQDQILSGYKDIDELADSLWDRLTDLEREQEEEWLASVSEEMESLKTRYDVLVTILDHLQERADSLRS